MEINPVSKFYTPNFAGAHLSLNAFSDSHGNLEHLDNFYRSIEENRDELFLENKRGNQNAFVVAGDWFISGDTTGYKSKRGADSHYFQVKFFNTFIQKIKQLSKNMAVYFVPGNHEFDAGDKAFAQVADKINAKILMTNLDFNNSRALKEGIRSGKIVQEDILEIEDDKNPNKRHKVLFLGINPVNMPAYKKGMKDINFINQVPKTQATVDFEDYRETFEETQRLIEDFKKKNPKGLVVVSVHTGVGFAQKLAEELGPSNVNVIFNAHEHKINDERVNGVDIVNLSQNFKKYSNVKIHLDDDGNIEYISKPKVYGPLSNRNSDGNSFFTNYFKNLFREDFRPEFKIRSDDSNVRVLDNKNVRFQNSFLANFITDTILSAIQETNPEVQIFAINASSMRGTLNTVSVGGANNLQVIETLGGITHIDASLYKNRVLGSTLMYLIADGLLFNEKSPERNPLMQYSGLIIDRKAILEGLHSGKSPEELTQFVRTAEDNKQIENDRTYTIANVIKYFAKSKNDFIHRTLFAEAEPLNLNAKDLFRNYMEEHKRNLYAKCDVRI